MDSITTFPQLVYAVYVPFIIALVSLAVPMVSILLSVFAQGREEISRIHQEEISKITETIKANELSKQHWIVGLFWQLTKKRYKLLILDPNYYLPYIIIPPVAAIIFAVLALNSLPKTFSILSLVLLVLFQFFLWSLIKTIAEVTRLSDNKKEERERATLEILQSLLRVSNPESSRVNKRSLYMAETKMNDGDSLPPATLGKEISWKVAFSNSELDIAAKKVEVGLQFPMDVFEIKKQSGYSVYSPDNIARFECEYIQKNTRHVFSPPITLIPKRTGKHTVTAWLKGENVTTLYLNLIVNVEIEV